MTKKKTVCIVSDYPILKTGLARNARCLVEYLYKTEKYNLVYYACGTTWDSPDYQRFPFKVVGALPNNPQEIEQIQRDPQQARDAAYGSYNVDRVIKELKPDILLVENDSWAMSPWIGRKWWNKIHCIPHITLDSLPFLPDQKKLIESSKKTYVWADFAKKESERLGYKNVDVISGIIDQKDFYKLPRHKKLELRKKSNIPEDAFIAGFVFRNQLRKELNPLLDGYNLFKKQNPEIKNTYLLLHTSFSEGAGWDIPRLCENIGINMSEILTTYICRNCKEYEIKPFSGQDLDCRFCSAKGGQITCNVACGCTEFQLNEVYNMMDSYIHLHNAGGLEIPLVESLYCELPLATVGYSSGEMFTDQSFVESIDFSWGIQIGTQFKRAVPYASSVAKVLKKFYLMTVQDREKIGKKGREWALSRFSPEIVCKQWEKVIDDLPDHGWDYDFQEPLKNPNAIIENVPENADFVESLYNKILLVPSDPQGKNYWLSLLQNGAKREQLEAQFKAIATEDNRKLGQLQNKNFEDILDTTDRKRLLVTMPQSIGDVFLITATFESLRERYPRPEWKFYFATDPAYFELLDSNPHIDKLIPFSPIMDNLLAMEGMGDQKGYFDVAYLAHASTQRFLDYVHGGIDVHGLELTK